MYPADEILIARGKHATLNKERRAQLKRMQSTCETAMSALQQVLKGAQESPPNRDEALMTLSTCVQSITDARARIVKLCAELDELRAIAWEGNAE